MIQHLSKYLTLPHSILHHMITSPGEEIGSEMTLRTFEHLLHYGELPVRRAVPLALALLYLSHPDYSVVDQLSRLSHDADADIAQCAILGLGLVAGGECLYNVEVSILSFSLIVHGVELSSNRLPFTPCFKFIVFLLYFFLSLTFQLD